MRLAEARKQLSIHSNYPTTGQLQQGRKVPEYKGTNVLKFFTIGYSEMRCEEQSIGSLARCLEIDKVLSHSTFLSDFYLLYHVYSGCKDCYTILSCGITFCPDRWHLHSFGTSLRSLCFFGILVNYHNFNKPFSDIFRTRKFRLG